MNKDLVRRVLLVAASILNWIFSVGYIREYNVISSQNHLEYKDEVYVDGEDFTTIANLAIAGANGFTNILAICVSVLLATILILFFAILLRATTIRKKDIVTEEEVKFTKWFIIASSVLALIVGILCTDTKLIGYVIALSWQQPMFMMLIYYLPLRKRYKKGTETDKSDSLYSSV